MAVHQAPEARDPSPSPSVGDAASWLDEHGDALYQYARARVGRRDAAEDLVQDTFVAALQSRGRYRGDASVRTWLVSILRHKIMDHHRRAAAAPPSGDVAATRESDAVRGRFFGPDGLWIRAVMSWKTPDRALEDREFREVLDGCLARLPRALASVFLLRESEGLEIAELGRTLDLSDGNIRVRLHRARLLLRECLERRWFAAPTGPREEAR